MWYIHVLTVFIRLLSVVKKRVNHMGVTTRRKSRSLCVGRMTNAIYFKHQ